MSYEVNDDPYDPASQDTDPSSIPLDEVIRRAISDAFLRLAVCRPARVVKVKGTQRVDLEVLMKAKYVGQDPFVLPTIQDALVWMPGGADYSVKLPVAVADVGLAVFCDRSLDEWSVSGGSVYPVDGRAHAISDAIFFPGLNPFGAQLADNTTDLVVTNGKGVFRVQKAGKFAVKGPNAELLAQISAFAAAAQSLATATASLASATADLASQVATICSTLSSSGLFSPPAVIAFTAAGAAASADGSTASTAGSNASTAGSNIGTAKGKIDGITGT